MGGHGSSEGFGRATKDEFAGAYFREWASWFSLPCQWAKQDRPGMPVGLYGPQPFRRDYWGVAGKSAQQIDGTHRSDAELWQYIDPQVDFYVASVYVSTTIPARSTTSRRTSRRTTCGHGGTATSRSTRTSGCDTTTPTRSWLARIGSVPGGSDGRGALFLRRQGRGPLGLGTGAKGPVLREPAAVRPKPGRISDLSERLAKAELVIDEPAHVLWKEKRPLVRKFKLSDDEWVVLAVNPWQADVARSSTRATCGTKTVELPLVGRHTGIFEVRGEQVTKR